MVHHRDTENTEVTENDLSRRVIGAAIDVHRNLGPGLLESVYKECLADELTQLRISYDRERSVALRYRARPLQSTLRLDFLVEGRLILEIKAIDALSDIHAAQLLTYLRLSNIHLGLLINFNVITLSKGIRRVINGYPEFPR